jgi:hypothetical protein
MIMQRLYTSVHAVQCAFMLYVVENSAFEFAIVTENKAGQVFEAGKMLNKFLQSEERGDN